jgi:hypothetical protein
MAKVQLYERTPIAKDAVKSAELTINNMKSRINQVSLIALQVTVTICLFEGLRDLIPQFAGPGYNIVLSAVVGGLVIFLTYMIMHNYQSLILKLGQQNDKLEEVLTARISELEKANEAMSIELSTLKQGK